jgi:hypothetical protein
MSRVLFKSQDRLAILLVNKKANSVIQRLGTAEEVVTRDFQSFLSDKNAAGFDVYLSANALKPDATGRTKSDVGTIRHIYLDFDAKGTEAVQALYKRPDLPVLSILVNTSPDKWQVVWQVEAFGPDEAENLQRMLARQTGADPAATDSARVLRFPGFYNHKYGEPYLVRLEPHAGLTGIVYRPVDFPKISKSDRMPLSAASAIRHKARHRGNTPSQSERDWAYAQRALARGDPEHLVIAAIATYRRFDKYNPHYYAELTVKKAAEHLAGEKRETEVRNDEDGLP